MNILYLTVFASLGLAALGLILFFHSAAQRDRDHIERLALLPLDDNDDYSVPPPPRPLNEGPHSHHPTPDEGDTDEC
ncbi:MAG: cytochrome oxidase [Deltaproteobacteria bacterium]|nr:MAG: cytochrome oxidase [Deltaproteobacteria bacterium]